MTESTCLARIGRYILGEHVVNYMVVMGNVLLALPLARVSIVEVKTVMSLRYTNEQTGAEAKMGRLGSGYYVEVLHPDFALPLRKTYEWHQQDLATRDFELLSALVGATRTQREVAIAS